MLNELPSLWTYLKQLWQDHTASNVTKKISPKEKNRLTIGFVFMISLTIRMLLTLYYGKIIRTRRKRIKTDHIESSEMQNLYPELPDNP
jgi:hypothetical protein